MMSERVSANMNNSLDDFDVNITVKKHTRVQLKGKENVQGIEDIKHAIPKKNKRAVADKSAQCGTEKSVNYAKKLKVTAAQITYRSLILDIIPNKRATLDFCFTNELVPSCRSCPTCGNHMTLISHVKVSDSHRWYCSVRKGAHKYEHRTRTQALFWKRVN